MDIDLKQILLKPQQIDFNRCNRATEGMSENDSWFKKYIVGVDLYLTSKAVYSAVAARRLLRYLSINV